MGLLDKIIDGMHLGDDYDDYDDDYDYDDEDDYEDSSERKSGIFKRNKDKDYEPEESSSKVRSVKTQSKIKPVRRKSGSGMAVCVFKPASFDEAREITETLLNNCTVIMNFEGQDVELAQRIIDFTSGSCFAIGGNLQKVSNYIFIATPRGVDISGDLQDILANAFDIPTI